MFQVFLKKDCYILSEDVIQNILKNDLDFKGLVVTDALNMKGVSEFSKVKNIDLMAFLAGTTCFNIQ